MCVCLLNVCINILSFFDMNSSLLVVFISQHLVGRLIGKQGRYVSFLKQNSGSKIYISTLPYTQEFQICHIEGESGPPTMSVGGVLGRVRAIDSCYKGLYGCPWLASLSWPKSQELKLPVRDRG